MGCASRMLKALFVSPTSDRVITLLFITRFEGLVVIDVTEDCGMECDDWTPTADGSEKGDGCADSDVDEPGADELFSGVRKS